MLGKLKGLFGKNKKELKQIEEKKGEYATLSEDALIDRREIIVNTNSLIDEFECANNKYEEEKENGASEIKLSRLKEKVEEKKAEIKCQSQGKIKSLIGTYFGQIDKKIHNKLYFRETLASDRLWDFHCYNVTNRYLDLPRYILKNSFGVLALSGISLATNFVETLSANTVSIISTLATTLSAGIALNAIVKVASTIFNKRKFGGPLLRQYEPLLFGSYKENILNAKFALRQSRELSKQLSSVDDTILDEPLEVLYEPLDEVIEETDKPDEEVMASQADITPVEEVIVPAEEMIIPSETSEETTEELVEPNINDYGNINLGVIQSLSKFREDPNEKLSYSKSVSLLRKVNANEAIDEDYEKKIAAYEKLYNTYGKRKPKKKKDDSNKKLNDYNRTLKLLAEYGRKVHSGIATQQEINGYWGLLYHLGKDDDFIGDFLADEYDRYQEDKKKYEEKKLIRKI